MATVFLAAFLAVSLTGCGTTASDIRAASIATEQRIGELESIIDTIDGELARARAELAALPDDAVGRDAIIGVIDEGLAQRDRVAGYLATARQTSRDLAAAIDEQGDVDIDAIAQLVTTAGQSLPPPFGGYATLAGIGVGLLGTIFGARKKRQADELDGIATEVVRSIEQAKQADPAVRRAIEDTPIVRTAQSAKTRQFVRAKRGA